MAEVVAKAIEMTSPLARAAHALDHRETAAAWPGRGRAIRRDSARWCRISLTNAAKYTPPAGSITISGEADGLRSCCACVTPGLGIAADVLPHDFRPVRPGAQAIDRSQGGLGLGLTIVRNLVERHGGTVSAHSDGPGQGAEFTIRLPRIDGCRSAAKARAGTGSAPDPGTRRRRR